MSDAVSMLDAALALASRGWRVHPLYPIRNGACSCSKPGCKAAGKHPRLSSWPIAASTDPSRLSSWWRANPDDGIGVATGPGSGVVVIDIDPRHGGDVSYAALLAERGESLTTLRVATGGGGSHHYFRAPSAPLRNGQSVLPGVDVRGAGGYVVGPGSPHVSGGSYAIDIDIEPQEMPAWLIDLCIPAKPPIKAQPAAPNTTADARERKYALGVLNNAVGRIEATPAGQKHEALLKEARTVGGYVGAGSLSEHVARSALLAAVGGQDGDDAARTLDDGLSYGARDPLRAPPESSPTYRAPSHDDCEPERGDEPEPELDDGTISTEPPDGVFRRGDEVELGQHLAEQLGGRGSAVADEGMTWRLLPNGGWEPLDQSDLASWAQGYAGRITITGKKPDGSAKFAPIKLSRRATQGIAGVAHDHLLRPGFFADAPHGAAFGTTFVRLDGRLVVYEVLRPDHRVRAGHVAPYDLPERGSAPVFHRLLCEAWAGCDDLDARISYLMEWIGAALLGITTRWKDSPFLHGRKDTSKSRIVDAILGLFPPSTRRHLSIHMLGNETHIGALAGARINAVAEVPSRELLDGETAKAVLAGDAVTANPKYRAPFVVHSRCAHIFAANEIPPSLDAALRDRFVLLNCPHVVPLERQDRVLRERLEAEAPHIAAAALLAVEGLLERGHFIRPPSSSLAARHWAADSDPVLAWSMACLEHSDAGRVSGAALYQQFCAWASTNGHRPMSNNRFGGRLESLGYQRTRSNGIRWFVRVVGDSEQEARAFWGMRES